MRIQIIILILIGVVLICAVALYFCSFTVNEREYVILTQFGKIVTVEDEPGLHLKLPGFIQTANRLDKRLHIFKSQPITLLLSDQNPIILACMICWKVSDPELFFRRVRDTKNASQKIGDMINSQLGSVLGNYTLDNIINVDPSQVKLEEIENLVLENTQAVAQVEYGISIARVGIRRLAYPTIVENSVYNRMRAEREKEAKKYRAEGRQERADIEAKTDKEVQVIMAEAYRDAQILKGEGDQESMRIYNEAYGKNPEFYEFLKSLEIYKQTLQENSTLILSTDSELFKYLNYGERKAGSSSRDEGAKNE